MTATFAFQTDRLVVRDWKHGEAERVLDLYSRWEVAQWIGNPPKPMEALDEANDLIARYAAFNADEPVGGRWAAQRKDTNVVAGSVLLVPLPDGDGEYEVGWHLHPDSWGHGFATEAGRAAIAHGFAGGLEEVFAVVLPENDRSIAVCRRLGMEPLGPTDRYYQRSLELFRITRGA